MTRRQLLGGIGAAGALGMLAPAIARSSWADQPPSTPRVTVDPSRPGARMDAGSLGFSFERATLALPLFDDSNTDLVGLFRRLGPGQLRLGGNTVDRTPWDASSPGSTAGSVAPADLAALRRFTDAADWTVLYGLPFVLAGSSPATAADETAVVAPTLGPRLAGYEFGNEPDLYAFDPAQAALAGTVAQFKARWAEFGEAVRAVDPATPFTGPGCCLLQTIDGFAAPFIAATGGSIDMVTQHYYRGFGGPGQTIDLLLTPDPLLAPALGTLAALTTTAGARGFRLTETNSFASGGQPGVSNTFASALWALAHHLDCTAAGAAGLDFHNSGSGAGYPAIVQIGGTVTEVRPLYYGLLLLAGLGPATHLPVTSQALPDFVRVHALAADDGTLEVVLSNIDPTTTVTVDVDLGVALASATVERLVAEGLDATSGVTFRGAPVAIDGSWDPADGDAIVVSGSTLSVTVAAASAVVVRARRTLAASTTTSTPTSTVTPAPTDPATRPAGPTPRPSPATAVPATPTYTG